MMEADVKRQVQDFYNQVGWQEVSEGLYQNARYEDLRPVAREYIERCHRRVRRHLKPQGRCLLDAGSGPIQYPEYLEYSRGYQARVCLDISIVALQEARKRIGDRSRGGHGLFVVADIANLPFKEAAFDGEVSLHTIHHLPKAEHLHAYRELYRALAPGGRAVVVNGWDRAALASLSGFLVRLADRLCGVRSHPSSSSVNSSQTAGQESEPTGTYVHKSSAGWLKKTTGREIPLEIRVWRSFNVRFLRTFVHAKAGGKVFLKLLYGLEERFPHFFGENGQYPMIIIRKHGTG